MTDDNGAILPVITAKMSSHYVRQRQGNILLDSGAPISLIRLETARNLRLSGQDVSITIKKVGGEEEEMVTKVYKVTFTSLERGGNLQSKE